MILVDTNVISELLRPEPNVRVISWLKRNQREGLYFSAIGIAEILRGCAILPDGKRRRQLTEDVHATIDRLFSGRILAFDEAAAIAYGELHGLLRTTGRPIGILDGQIAAIALAHGMTVATRDVQPFVDAGVEVINPWEQP